MTTEVSYPEVTSSISPSASSIATSSSASTKILKPANNDLTWRPFVFGGIASVVAECSTFPIDTSKTRLQIQGQALDNSELKSRIRYRGMLHAISSIAKEEGAAALYFGIKPALLRQATYGTIKFGLYYRLKRLIVGKDTRQESLSINVFCGVVAGASSAAITAPTDVLKVRMQAQTGRVNHKESLVRCFGDIYQKEGVKGLWRGVGPTSQRAAVVVGVELPVYDGTKSWLLSRVGDGVLNHFISSMAAGLASAAASTPIDVIKTRIMNQRNLRTTIGPAGTSTITMPYHLYQGSLDCLVQTVKHEGVWALYKGFIPNWIRLGPWNVVFFLTFEQLKKSSAQLQS